MRHWIIAFVCVCVPSVACAWSTKEHVQITRIAVVDLLASPGTPEPMKAWLTDVAPGLLDMEGERNYLMNARMGMIPKGVDGLMFWSVMPDMVALTDRPNKKVPPLNVPERTMHYFELEFYGANPPATSSDEKPKAGGTEMLGDAAGPSPAPAGERARPTLKPDPAQKPEVASIKRDPKDPRLLDGGALPYRVAQAYGELLTSFRDGRLNDKPGQFPRDEHAARWAGYIAHYVQDSTQPHHSTWDYKSRAFFPPGTKSPDVHAVVEYKFCDDENADYTELRAAYWPLFVAALADAKELADAKDPWTATVQACSISYDALPLIGEAAVAAWDKGGKPESPQDEGRVDVVKFYNHRGQAWGREMSVLEMKAKQQAWAVRRTQAIWLAAWKEAHGGVEPGGELMAP